MSTSLLLFIECVLYSSCQVLRCTCMHVLAYTCTCQNGFVVEQCHLISLDDRCHGCRMECVNVISLLYFFMLLRNILFCAF